MFSPTDFFDLDGYVHKEIFNGCTYVWEAIAKIGQYIMVYATENNDAKRSAIKGKVLPGAFIDNGAGIYVGEGSIVEPGAFIQGPCIIGKNCQVRSGAYIRGNVITGDNCIIGHTSELKNAIMLNHSQAPHFNYVGDSVLGSYVNLGCGTICSNVPLVSFKDRQTGKRPPIILTIDGVSYNTGLAKFGAIVGDNTETGCNTVLNPGCLVGRNCRIYPGTSLPKGYYKDAQMIKLRQQSEFADRYDIK